MGGILPRHNGPPVEQLAAKEDKCMDVLLTENQVAKMLSVSKAACIRRRKRSKLRWYEPGWSRR